MEIKGAGFIQSHVGLVVLFSGKDIDGKIYTLTAPPSSVVNNGSTLYVTVPDCASGLNCQGNMEVTVSNNGGINVATNPALRFYLQPSIKVFSVSPMTLPTDGSVALTLTGSGLNNRIEPVVLCRFDSIIVPKRHSYT